jgi:hypothetical protein
MKNPQSESISSVGRPLTSRSEARDAAGTFKRLRTPLMLLLAAFALTACSRAEAPQTSSPAVSPPSAPGSNSGSQSAPSANPSANPSPGTADGAAATLPPSTTAAATSTPAPAAAVDAKETNPKGNLSKEQEQQAMPQAQQVNNHSSPALDRDTSKP